MTMETAGAVRFVQCSGVSMPLEAAPMLGHGFEHQTKGLILSNVPIDGMDTAVGISVLCDRFYNTLTSACCLVNC